jgi:hypothetical protein
VIGRTAFLSPRFVDGALDFGSHSSRRLTSISRHDRGFEQLYTDGSPKPEEKLALAEGPASPLDGHRDERDAHAPSEVKRAAPKAEQTVRVWRPGSLRKDDHIAALAEPELGPHQRVLSRLRALGGNPDIASKSREDQGLERRKARPGRGTWREEGTRGARGCRREIGDSSRKSPDRDMRRAVHGPAPETRRQAWPGRFPCPRGSP